jgi:hypothetical protein
VGKFLLSNPIYRILDIYVKILAILGLLIVAGFIDLSSKIEYTMLKPIYVVDLEGFERYYIELANKPPTEFLNSLRKSTKERFLVVDYPPSEERSKGWERVVTDGNKIFSYVPLGYNQDDYKFQLGFPNYNSNYVTYWMERELKTEEDKRVAISPIVNVDISRSQGHFGRCNITSDSLFKLIEMFPDHVPADKYGPLFRMRNVYNMISIENPSESKIKNIIIKIFKIFNPTEMKMVGWTFSIHGGYYSVQPEKHVEFHLPFLGPKQSVQMVVRSKSFQLEREDIHIEYDKLRSLNKSLIELLLVLSFIASILIVVVESGLKI